MQQKIFTTLADAIKVTISIFCIFFPIIDPDAETQIIFNDSINTGVTFSLDSWLTDGRGVETGLEFQLDIGPVLNVYGLKYLKVAHQFLARIGVPNNGNNISVFDNLDVRNSVVEIGGVRYQEDSIRISSVEIDHLDQCRHPNFLS